MKTKSIFTAVLLTLSLNTYAAPSDTDRIADLERRVAQLDAQVTVLLAERNRLDVVNDRVHVCTIRAFADSFRAENVNRAQAKLDVLRQCRNKHGEMFCTEYFVRCEIYR